MIRRSIELLALSLLLSIPAVAHETDSPFDQHFMTKMIPHHQMGIDMAKQCVAKATHEELKAMCRKIIEDQEKETAQMGSWLQAWYKNEHAAGHSQDAMMKQGQQMMKKMNGMSGAEFEKHFMNEMSQHHRQALKDAEACVSRASHAELKSLCTTMAESQRKEIEQMHAWLCSWYKDCHEAETH